MTYKDIITDYLHQNKWEVFRQAEFNKHLSRQTGNRLIYIDIHKNNKQRTGYIMGSHGRVYKLRLKTLDKTDVVVGYQILI